MTQFRIGDKTAIIEQDRTDARTYCTQQDQSAHTLSGPEFHFRHSGGIGIIYNENR
jgi:hypothetical protein